MAGYERALERSLLGVRTTLEEVGDRFPMFARHPGDTWTTSRRGSWTGGFWVGLLWLRAAVTGERAHLRTASDWTESLLPRADDSTSTRAMTFWYGAALGHLLTGDARAAEVAHIGAKALAADFRPELGIIPMGTAFGTGDAGLRESFVDPLAALVRLLPWADGAHTALARSHLDEHVRLCLNAGGAVSAHLRWDEATSQLRPEPRPGTWSRGQAWALLGLAEAATALDGAYLPFAHAVAEHWLRTRPHQPPPDRTDGPPAALDTSAAAISASALITLGRRCESGRRYRDFAMATVDALVGEHLTGTGALLHGSYRTGPDGTESVETVWGNFFLTLTLAQLTGAVGPL
ncbi:glucuronyl hydrolase [Saccharopolyspora erythraea]|uniref:glucuronyl hydrolase n=1 Tax=Saccharopolyspora erythraea TaxID=1836 RepID=UPI001BAA1013|nr:glucuronyl hydrolase [Saccharopolyspora erythraea]QUH02497.1 glucuronyl hydrolase [Saccharopolyspora erythraea]